MANKKGNLSINSENMFPIIKKWLYSDHDIFYRELISNACDAITKIRKMDVMGDYTLPEDYKPRVDVILNPEDKTIQVVDNGIGMTADEVEEYINQVAFSGATDFLEKYKDKGSDDQIIGHFGLGFYSAFMVSDRVDIDTLSYKEGAEAVHWTCDGSSEFEMTASDRKTVGSTITLHLSEDCVEFCNNYRAREVIEKYCSFMPFEIYLSREKETDTQIIDAADKRDDDEVIEEVKETEKKEAGKEGEKKEEDKKPPRLKIKKRPELLNDIHPLWTKTPQDCTAEEYKAFYRKVFNDYKEPLFWIHLNMDYPFNLKGILYFPKINLEYETVEGKIKLYNNQVFIADNIKEVIPEFLMLLKGVIDCPDLPLNVSRSALQNDGFVKKISDYITKKVAEKLAGLCKTDKENYDKYWDDISPFIKFGCLKDDKFCEKMNDYILFKNLDGKYITLPDALHINDEAEKELKEGATSEDGEKVQADIVDANGNPIESDGKEDADKKADSSQGAEDKKDPEKEKRTIYYVTDVQQQSQYIKLFKDHKMEAFILDQSIDTPFIQQLEMKNEGIRFLRIDADITDAFKSHASKKSEKEFEEAEKTLGDLVKKAVKNDKLTLKIERLKDKKIASMMTVSEESRRMADMMKMYGMNGMPAGDFGKEGITLILNAGHPLVKYVMDHQEGDNAKTICEQLYDLAQLQNGPLGADEMTAFVRRSNDIMMMMTKE